MNTDRKSGQSTADDRIAVLGLGNMGLGMAVTLKSAGWQVVGYDPDSDAVAAARDRGISCVTDVRRIAADTVVLSLPAAAVVRQVVPGLLHDHRLRLIVDTTTSDPQTSQEMQDMCAAESVLFVDAPVSGGRTGAWSGNLAAFVGGSDAAVRAATAVLDTLTAQWTHLGPIGSGNMVKLLNNVLCAANLVSVAEAIDVIAAHGLDIPRAVAALNTGSGRSAVSQVVFENSILKGELSGGFAIGLMTRDVELGLDVAASADATPTVLAAVRDAWVRARERLGPAADCNLAPSTFTTATACLSPPALRRSANTDNNEKVSPLR